MKPGLLEGWAQPRHHIGSRSSLHFSLERKDWCWLILVVNLTKMQCNNSTVLHMLLRLSLWTVDTSVNRRRTMITRKVGDTMQHARSLDMTERVMFCTHKLDMTERLMFCTHKLGSFSVQLCFAVGITCKHQTLVSLAFECGLMEPLSRKLSGSQPQIGVMSLSWADLWFSQPLWHYVASGYKRPNTLPFSIGSVPLQVPDCHNVK